MNRVLAIGECMVELKQADGGLMQKGFAGDTFNAAYYTRLFLPQTWSVAYLSALGTDVLSADMLAFMAQHGIDTTAVRQIEGATPGLYMIHLHNGERSFSYWRSASAARRLADDPAHVRTAIDAAGVIVFSGITLAILAPDAVETLLLELRRARAAGKCVVFDPNIRQRLWPDRERMKDTIEAGARAASLVMPSFDDEMTTFGDTDPTATIARYRRWGADNVVVKNGGGDIALSFGSAIARVTPSQDAAIVDTTSAGDSFNGAFLARYVTGHSPEDAAAFAARIAAAVIGRHGALVAATDLPEAGV